MVIKVWNLYALQTVDEIVCSVLCKGIAVAAQFYIVKDTAANAVPLLSYNLCSQFGITHELGCGFIG